MNENEFKDRLEQLNDDAPLEVEEEEEEEIIPTLNEDGVMDFTDYMKSEAFIRDSKESILPAIIEYKGKKLKVFVKPLTSQEYYRIQLDAMNKKESLDLLACQKCWVDGDGNPLDPLVLMELNAGVIQEVSARIRLISGIDTEGMDYKDILSYFLKI